MSTPTLKMLLVGKDVSASKALKGVGSQADDTAKHVASFGKIAKGVFAGMIVRDAVRGTVDFLKDSAKAAIEDQESTDRLAKAMHNATGATKAQDAAVEGWISKMELAKGVTDTDLRGGLQRLVQSTHSVTQSQKLMGVALDAAAGTGKSVTVVATALAKAHDGNVGALGRLGVATKDAKGKTLSFNEVVKNMATTFKGQSTKAADSMQGRMNRLKVTWDEMKETVGYKLLPVLETLGEWFLIKGVPAVQAIVTEVAQALTPAFDRVKTAVQNLQPFLQGVGNFLQKNPKTVEAFAVALTAMGAALLVVTTAMKALDVVMAIFDAEAEANPIGAIVLALAALAAGLQYAYTHSEKFRTVVDTTFKVVSAAGKDMWNVIKPILKLLVQTWLTVVGAILNGAAKAFGWVPGIGGKLKGAAAAFNSFKASVNNSINGITPSKTITIHVTDVHHIGAANPNKPKVNSGGLAPRTSVGDLSPRAATDAGMQFGAALRKGAASSKNKVSLSEAGKELVDSFISGTKKDKTKLGDALKSIRDQVKQSNDQLKSDVASFADGFTSFSSSVFGADYGTDLLGNAITPTVSAILAKAQGEKSNADTLKANVAKLVKAGANSDVLQQLQSAGSSGVAEINALASGATAAQIRQLNSLTTGTLGSDRAAGMAAAGVITKTAGTTLFSDAQAVKLATTIASEIGKLGNLGDHVVVMLDGKEIIASIERTKRKQGKSK